MRLTVVVNENVPHDKYSTMKAVQARIIGLKMAWEYLLESGNVSLAVAAASVRSLNPSTPLPLKTSAMFHVGSPLASRPAKCGVCDPACILGWHGLWQNTKFIQYVHACNFLACNSNTEGRTATYRENKWPSDASDVFPRNCASPFAFPFL